MGEEGDVWVNVIFGVRCSENMILNKSLKKQKAVYFPLTYEIFSTTLAQH